jgi:hypothetical protein
MVLWVFCLLKCLAFFCFSPWYPPGLTGKKISAGLLPSVQ